MKQQKRIDLKKTEKKQSCNVETFCIAIFSHITHEIVNLVRGQPEVRQYYSYSTLCVRLNTLKPHNIKSKCTYNINCSSIGNGNLNSLVFRKQARK